MLETMYEKLFQSAPVPMIVTDVAGTITLANAQACHLLDSGSQQLEGLGFCAFIDQSFLKTFFGNRSFSSFDEFLKVYSPQHDHWIKSGEGIAIYTDIKSVSLGSGIDSYYIWTFDPLAISKKLRYDLNERAKEQLCILNVIELCFQNESIPRTLEHTLLPIKEGWQFPEVTEVQISLSDGSRYATPGFRKTEWCLEAALTSGTETYGHLAVCYREKVPAYGGRIFLVEEERLVAVLGKLIGAIIEHHQNSRRINEAVVNAQEEERYQLAMELHDNVQQILTAATLKVDFLQSINREGTAQEMIGKLKATLTEAIRELRQLSQRLAPSTDPEFPLTEKIQLLTRSMSVNGRLDATIDVDPGMTLNGLVELGFYRIIQEQLTNIVKYAGTSEVAISIREEGKNVILRIQDEGVGFDAAAKKEGIGFENMRRRTESMKGSLDIQSAPGKGTQVIVQVPLALAV